jgi:hypothetical protein
VRHVVDVAGHRVAELVDLVHQCRDEECDEPDDREEGGDAHEGHGVGALDLPRDEPLDRRVQGEREEDRDDDPRQHAAREPDHLQHDRDAQDDPENGQNGLRAEAHEALGDHGGSMAWRPDAAGSTFESAFE